MNTGERHNPNPAGSGFESLAAHKTQVDPALSGAGHLSGTLYGHDPHLVLIGQWIVHFLAAVIAGCVIPGAGILMLLVLDHGHLGSVGTEAIGYLWPYMVAAGIISARYEWWHRHGRPDPRGVR